VPGGVTAPDLTVTPACSHPLDRLFRLSFFGWSAFGIVVAALTVRINPAIHADLGGTAVLLLYGIGGYGALGLALGAVAELVARAARRALGPSRATAIRRLVGAALLATPLAYALLLPDLGLFPRLLTDARGRPSLLVLVALLVSGFVVLTALLASRAHRRSGRPSVGLATGWVALLVASLAFVVATRPAPSLAGQATDPAPVADPAAPPPAPVVLLCIDGADLDQVIRPLVAEGRLPTFARLLAEGTSGSLATLEPTLSPVIWTTIVTGRPPEAHGVWHFVHVRLPGLEEPVGHFPVHTGLNFGLFPWLADLGLPPLHAPTTSSMRRVRTLWDIVGDRYTVGSYRWLMTWPAERVNGFSVAGGPAWIDYVGAKRLDRRSVYPPELRAEIFAPPRDLDPAEYAPFVQPGVRLDPATPAGRTIERSLRSRTAEILPRLIERFGSRFTASAFYPVDAYHHLFARDRTAGGPFAPAIDAAYELTDRRLGELLDALPRPRNLVVVSDHGFDFENRHHTWSPPGLFIAHGPAFHAGRSVEGLSVYDVAPLVLHLLGFPLADDMPGTTRGAYRAVLRQPGSTAAPTLATYETGERSPADTIPATRDEELEKVLRSLGYVN
jgi:hypothetical protein